MGEVAAGTEEKEQGTRPRSGASAVAGSGSGDRSRLREYVTILEREIGELVRAPVKK
jgi:hypothetical protein